MFCGSCGASSAETSQFCPSCGQPLNPPAPPPVTPGWPAAAQQSLAPKTSGKAIASLVLGLFFWTFPAAIAAVVFGHISRGEIRRSGGKLKGDGLALAGLILGYIGVAAIAAILVIAAFMIPNLTRGKIAGNEVSAVASIRAINEAEVIYSSSNPDAGFTPNLAMLGGTAEGGGERTIDNNLASGRKTGYTFTYTPGEKVNGAIRSYTVTAVPDEVGTTGERRFYSDESGEVHYNTAGPADVNSPLLQ